MIAPGATARLDASLVDVATARRETSGVNAMLQAVEAKYPGRVTLLRPEDYMCHPACEFTHEGVWRYRDAGHLSTAGSLHFASKARDSIVKFLKAAN